MSRTRLQDEYNAAIRAADFFVLLVHTKVGRYSAEEIETAHRQFQATSKPLIYTFFKNSPDPSDDDPGADYATVRALHTKLAGLGHFITRYQRIDGLIDHFTQQLDKLRAKNLIHSNPRDGTVAAVPTYQANVTGSGAIAQGRGAQAVGAGSVAIGSNNSGAINVGMQTHVHTAGAAHVGGNVSVQGGDFVSPSTYLVGTRWTKLVAFVARELSKGWIHRLSRTVSAFDQLPRNGGQCRAV